MKALAAEITAAEAKLADLRQSASGLQVSSDSPSAVLYYREGSYVGVWMRGRQLH